ncbi:unnamed protein product, partial [Mesorhabditis spiculigera]
MRATQTFVFAMLQHGLMAVRSTTIAPLEIHGKTPCCIDRLTTLACSRLAATRKRYFDQQCANNADFAFIQCCASCFSKKTRGGKRAYDISAKKLLLDPYSTTCTDRRGPTWCHKILSKQDTAYGVNTEVSHSCKSFPFAFRECRQSCGFCSSGQIGSRLKYNYTIATDPKRCTSKIYYALDTDAQPTPTIRMPMGPRTTTKIAEEVPEIEPTTPTSPDDEMPTLEGPEPSEAEVIEKLLSLLTINPEEPMTEVLNVTASEEPEQSPETTTVFDPLAHLDLDRRRKKHKGYFIAEITENDLTYAGPREPEF